MTIKINLKTIIGITVGAIGLIASFMTIDGWLQDRYTKDIPNVTIEQHYYINEIKNINYESIYYKK